MIKVQDWEKIGDMANRKFGNTSPEAIRKLKEHFLSTTISIPELAAMSQVICGQNVNYDALIEYVHHDPEGDWEVTRNSLNFARSENVGEEVNHIRQIVYQQIIAANESGLLIVGEFDESEIKERLSDMKDTIKIVRIRPGGVDSAMVNAYMNLLSKSNIPINISGSSAKTAREQGLDYIRQAKEELGFNGH